MVKATPTTPVLPTPQNPSNDATIVTPPSSEGARTVGRPNDDEATLEVIDNAINSIRGFVYSSPTEEEEARAAKHKEEEEALLLLAMYNKNAKTSNNLQPLVTGDWPHGSGRNKAKPSPITISKARKLLAAAYANVTCGLDEAGVHGYAWMIEEEDKWLNRSGITSVITPPEKPSKKKCTGVMERLAYAEDMEEYKMYAHMVQEGRAKVIEWFGDDRFEDLYVDELLPVEITPRELLDHLALVYAQEPDDRIHMEQVEKDFKSPYDPKQPVEAYFKKLQQARIDATVLGEPYTDIQVMRRALNEFDRQYSKDARKAEKKWLERPKEKRTWTAFKTFWKNEIHQLETHSKSRSYANQAMVDKVEALSTELASVKMGMSELQDENRSYQEQSSALAAIQHALQTEQQSRGLSYDDLSTITEQIMAGFNASSSSGSAGHSGNTNNRGGASGSADNGRALEAARRKPPDMYKNSNDGRGLMYNRYCWNCGCNCTHTTTRCYELTEEQKQRYAYATCSNTMGGSRKHLERRDMWQKDFGFDSL